MYLLEEEVVIDELLLGSVIHAIEGVELTGEVAFEGLGSLNDLGHDLIALLLGDTGAKREVSKVTADADTSRDDHGAVLLVELTVREALGGHVGDVADFLGVALVVVEDDVVEELGPLGVGVVGAGVKADARVEVLDAREDAGLERDTGSVRLVLEFLPSLLRQESGER